MLVWWWKLVLVVVIGDAVEDEGESGLGLGVWKGWRRSEG